MKIKEETKLVEQKVFTFVAEDGTEFTTGKECKDYEEKQIFKALIEEAEKLRIEEMDEDIPLSHSLCVIIHQPPNTLLFISSICL